MPIIQINLWICEMCGALETQSSDADVWSDPVIVYPGWNQEKQIPEGWNHQEINGKYLLICPDCRNKED